jgi:N-acetylmuramoyl-L-alanine amidase
MGQHQIPLVTFEDLEIMSKTVYGEARGESYEGKVAVAYVIINRWLKKSWYGDSIAGVCKKPYQFSCWNENDPNLNTLRYVKLSNSPPFVACVKACLEAIGDVKKDITEGATHYHTSTISPKWAEGKVPVVEIGHHLFYNNID